MELCGGRVRLVVFSLAGDLEYLANELGLPHWGSLNPCAFCPISRELHSPHRFTDVSANAAWKDELVTIAQDKAAPLTQHPVSRLRNHSRFLSTGDLMHTGPLGVLGWLMGAIIWELVFDGVWGGGTEERIQRLWEQIDLEYEVQNSRD